MDMTTKHNHDNGKALGFGRLKPEGDCPRCDELRGGAEPRTLAGFDQKRKRAEWDREDAATIRRNTERGLCACGKPQGHDNGMCTAFQW